MDELWDTSLPNYARESSRIWQTCIVAAMFYLFLLPVWFGRIGRKKTEDLETSTTQTSTSTNAMEKEDPPLNRRLTMCGGLLGVICLVITVVDLSLYFSAYNYYAPRRVFALPIMTQEECHTLVRMAHHAAETNFQTYLQSAERKQQAVNSDSTPEFVREPIGWRKEGAPTAFLNLQHDPFSAANRTWLTSLMDRRLAPTLSRIYGVAPSSTLMATDVFVVRYDARGGTAGLPYHVDAGDITFSILLHAEEEEDEEEASVLPSGGGSRFWNRRTGQPFALVKPAVGTLLAYSANIPHEEVAVTAGTRVMLIGNLQIEQAANDYNLLASWFNMAWLLARCKYDVILPGIPGAWHRWWHDAVAPWLESTGDALAPHQVETLVPPEKATTFLQVLDEVSATTSVAKATWWKLDDVKTQSETSDTPKDVHKKETVAQGSEEL